MKDAAVQDTETVSGGVAHSWNSSFARVHSLPPPGPSTGSNAYQVLPAKLRTDSGRTTPYQQASLPTPPQVKRRAIENDDIPVAKYPGSSQLAPGECKTFYQADMSGYSWGTLIVCRLDQNGREYGVFCCG